MSVREILYYRRKRTLLMLQTLIQIAAKKATSDSLFRLASFFFLNNILLCFMYI